MGACRVILFLPVYYLPWNTSPVGSCGLYTMDSIGSLERSAQRGTVVQVALHDSPASASARAAVV